MKKILLLLPIIGICSSLFAQAPKVENVQAEQQTGTKDVTINFTLTGKAYDPAFGSTLNLEVWFREDPTQEQWVKVESLGTLDFQGLYLPLPGNEGAFDPAFGTPTIYSHKIEATEFGDVKNLIWKAGDDAPNVNTSEAMVRVIAFYPKTDEFGGLAPAEQQVSGWNGTGDFNAGGTTEVDSDGDGVPDHLDAYPTDPGLQ